MSRMTCSPVSAALLLLASILLPSIASAQRATSKPQEIFAPYWTSESGWDTELKLKNNLPLQPLTVSPVLRLASGQEIPLTPVTIASNDSVSVWANEGLLEHAPGLLNQPGSYGSVVFRFTSTVSMGLQATAVPSIHGEPIAFSIPAHPAWQARSSAQGPHSLEGIWWQPRSGLTDILVISNGSDGKVTGRLSLFGASGRRWSEDLTLGPHQTERIAMNDLLQESALTGSYGGISFDSSASLSAVDAVHFMYDETGKSSASFEMFSRDPNATLLERAGPGAKRWVLRAPMLALRSPDPALGLPPGTILQPTILVRNTTAKTISADIALSWRSNSGKGIAKLAELRLGPFATQQLQIGELQKQLGIPDDAHWALASLTTSASPDDLIAIASSPDTSGRYWVETKFIGGRGGRFAGGEWRADTNHNEIAAITNIGTKPADALLTLHYDNGKQKYELQRTIAPGDQMWVNLAQLIRNRVADRKGKTLPSDLNSVTPDVQDLTPGGHGLMVNAVALDRSFGFQAGPDVLTCCGDDDASWAPEAFDLVIDGTEFGSISGVNQCTGQVDDISSDFTSWWSGNSAVATVTTKEVQGVAPGSTDAYASGYVEEGNGSYCTVVAAQAAAPINVCPTSTSIGSTTAENLQKLFPTDKTGVGSYVAVDVSPSTPSGVVVTETISTGSTNTCPNGFPNACTTSKGNTNSLFVDTASTAVDGTPLPAEPNVMWDEHTVESNVSLLASGQSCTVTCGQQLSCGGTVIGKYTITFKFTTSTINGTLVTNVAASVQ